MILVTLGTQDKPFNRLLEAIQKEIDKGNIKDKVVVQAGHTKFESKDMEIFDLIPRDDFNELLKKCDILITHGGVGSIISGLKKGKIVIAVPRLAEYMEHDNDHQLQIINKFNDEGYIIGSDTIHLEESLNRAKIFIPKFYKSNTNKIIKVINNFIETN